MPGEIRQILGRILQHSEMEDDSWNILARAMVLLSKGDAGCGLKGTEFRDLSRCSTST